MTIDTQAFQAFLYDHIPAVKYMQLAVQQCTPALLSATAPIAPNINDKNTVFGGSSAALMTICGWSLIKMHLEKHGTHNDVVVHQADSKWIKAQDDDMIIKASVKPDVDWQQLATQIKSKNRVTKLSVHCQVLNQNHELCSEMTGKYVILKKPPSN